MSSRDRGHGASPRNPSASHHLAGLCGLVIGIAAPNGAWSDTPFEIAVVAPMSGPSRVTGKSIERGTALALEKFNAAGGLGGQPLRLRFHDDKNDARLARARAEEILREQSPLAIIGHWDSECSVAAGPLYREAKVPALSPGSMSLAVTKDNDWYFSMTYSARLEAQVLAQYLHTLLRRDDILLLSEDSAYGEQLRSAFLEAAENSSMRVSTGPMLREGRSLTHPELVQIAETLSGAPKPRTIVLAMRAEPAAVMVRGLRDLGVQDLISGASTLSESSFLDALAQAPAEQNQPGYYSHGIYALTPLLYAAAGVEAQRFRERYRKEYGEEPSWVAAYAYDAARVLTELARSTSAPGQSIDRHRARIRDGLAAMQSPETALRGVTGSNYFDADRFARRPPMMAVFHGAALLPALTQLEVSPRRYAAGSDARPPLVVIDDLYLSRRDIVSTGAVIDSIAEIDLEAQSYQLDFQIWFRHASAIDLEDIVFSNAVGALEKTLIESIEDQDIQYRLYRVRGRFRAEMLARYKILSKLRLPVRLRHRTIPRDQLLFARDAAFAEPSRTPRESQALAVALNPATGFTALGLSGHERIIEDSGFGSPRAEVSAGAHAPFSEFEIAIEVERAHPPLIGLFPKKWAPYLLVASLLALGAMFRPSKQRTLSRRRFWLLVAGTLCGLLAGEVLASRALLADSELQRWLPAAGKAFDMAWWLAPALLLNLALSTYFWEPIALRSGHAVPTTVRRASLLLLLLFAVFGILAFVFDQKITSLLATSGVVAMIVGLAIQINISNIVSGLILNMEKPFKIGDWVQIDDQVGQVVDINWRATRLHTLFDNIISIPNTKVAELLVVNYHYPTNSGWFGFTIHIEADHDPEGVKTLLARTLTEVPLVLEPWVVCLGLTEWSAEYGVYYRIADYARSVAMKDAVVTQLWTALRNEGVRLAMRKQEVYLPGEAQATRPKLRSAPEG